jgi:MFS transporter, putative metabolite:H+ symporter
MTKKSWLIIIVAALGYFVDIYDLILFGIIKKESLFALGYDEVTYKAYEILLFNYQMTGMVIGGIIWGILGDKRGRVIVLFGSILMYSLANIANAFVTNIEMYKVLRLVAGIGLAGELGAGVTLISETMEKGKRGLGTMIIVTFGALGGVFAKLVGNKCGFLNDIFHTSFQNWQIAYIVGGVMGLVLLVMRTSSLESTMYEKMQKSIAPKGNFWQILSTTKLRNLYLSCIAVGIPIWFIVGVLINLADRFALQNSGIKIDVSNCIMWTYIGLSSGDIISGVLSQILKNRKTVIYIYLTISFFAACVFIFTTNQQPKFYYTMSYILGFGTGYWALFVINSAEQFGTNLRATASSTVPNFVRGCVVPITLMFQSFSAVNGVISAGFFICFICFLLAVFGTAMIEDGFDKELDFLN